MVAPSTGERRYLLDRLAEQAKSELKDFWDSQIGDDNFADTVSSGYRIIVDRYREAAGQMAATWFEDADPTSDYIPKVAPLPAEGQLDSTADWALGGSGDEGLTRLEGSLQRTVYDGARDTTLLNVQDTGGSWLRQAEPDACEFCLGLEGEYGSDEAAGFAAHDNCQCMAVENRDGGDGGATGGQPDTTQGDGLPDDLEGAQMLAEKLDVRANFSDLTVADSADPAGTAQLAKQAIQAAADVHDRYPMVQANYLTWDGKMHSDTVGSTVNGIPAENWVFLNEKYLNDPELFRTTMEQTADNGFHYRGTGDPAYDVTMHEMGHVAANTASYNGVPVDSDTIDHALLRYWTDTNPAAKTITDDNEFADAFFTWKQEQMSGYSFTNTHEAIAEAFMDVNINGDNAHESSKVIHAILNDALEGKKFEVPTDGVWPFTAPADPPPPMNFGATKDALARGAG